MLESPIGPRSRRRLSITTYFFLFALAVFAACYTYRQFFPALTPHQRQRASMERYFNKLEEYARQQREYPIDLPPPGWEGRPSPNSK